MVGLRDVYVVAPAASFHPPAAYHEPFLPSTASPYLVDDESRSSMIHFWQSHPLPSPALPQNPNPSPSPEPESPDILFVTAGSSTCQDCGNQAKKDCSHHRCRTCCKNRGYDCSTHIKSTWVPAARRRERHLTASDSPAAVAVSSSGPISALKKPRLLSFQTTTISPESNSGTLPLSFETGYPSFRERLPGQVRAPAVFKCVRVTSIDDGEDEYAYHAKVNIGGHVFKGFLYNQGFDEGINADLTGTSTAINVDNNVKNASSTIPDFSELHLGGGGVRNVAYSDVYGLGGLLGGASFGNAIN